MPEHRVFALPFGALHTAYVNKAERKGRTRQEVEQVITWLTGHDGPALARHAAQGTPLADFFAQAPALNPQRHRITGVVCGVRVEAVQDPLMQLIRQLDKLVDELAKGKPMDKVLRT